jgi:Domain of unknown function (DUF5668)
VSASLWQFVRAIRGPILLIVFGALVALNQLDRIDFGRTWPILVIVYGILLLLDKMMRPATPSWPGQGPAQTQFPQGGAQ